MVLMNLSKAFDFLNHKLLIAKRHAYGFNRDSLKQAFVSPIEKWKKILNNKSVLGVWY